VAVSLAQSPIDDEPLRGDALASLAQRRRQLLVEIPVLSRRHLVALILV
jgi:hypothetical protein